MRLCDCQSVHLIRVDVHVSVIHQHLMGRMYSVMFESVCWHVCTVLGGNGAKSTCSERHGGRW